MSSEDRGVPLWTAPGAAYLNPAQEDLWRGIVPYPVLDTLSVQAEEQELPQPQTSYVGQRFQLRTLMTRSMEPYEVDDDAECPSTHDIPPLMPCTDSTGLLHPPTQEAPIDIWIDDVLANTEQQPASDVPFPSIEAAQPLTLGEKPNTVLPPSDSRPSATVPASSPSMTPAKDGVGLPAQTISKQDLSNSPLRGMSSMSSNKENITPSTTPSPRKVPLPPPVPTRYTPGLSFPTSPLVAPNDSSVSKPRLSFIEQGNAAPVCGLDTNMNTDSGKLYATPSPQSFRVHKLVRTSMTAGRSPTSETPPMTQVEESCDVKELSPQVEIGRGGKRAGMKRERCASYWDEDILGESGREGAAEDGNRRKVSRTTSTLLD